MPTVGPDRRPPATPGRWLRRAAGVAALVAVAATGCRNSNRTGGLGGGLGGTGSLTARNTDPLMGGSRIPPQDLPIPGRDAYGAADRKDPLLDTGKPAARGDKTERTEAPPPKKTDAAALPTRNRPAYRPDRSTTAAALAGRLNADDSDLSIGTRPTVLPVKGTASGPVPLRKVDDTAATGGRTYDQIVAQLRDLGATWSQPTQEDGQYVFRCNVPLAGDENGRSRTYEDVGATAAAAAKKVLDNVRADYAGQ